MLDNKTLLTSLLHNYKTYQPIILEIQMLEDTYGTLHIDDVRISEE